MIYQGTSLQVYMFKTSKMTDLYKVKKVNMIFQILEKCIILLNKIRRIESKLMNHPESQIDDIQIVGLQHCKSENLVHFYIKNKTHLADAMPLRDESFYQSHYWDEQIADYAQLFKEKCAIKFVLLKHEQVIGTITFDQICYGAFRSCYLGYLLDQDYQGKGIMTKALQFCLSYIIKDLNLNRVMANYVPENLRSGKLLRQLGFEREGYARKYLLLNGVWKDHILTSYINDT